MHRMTPAMSSGSQAQQPGGGQGAFPPPPLFEVGGKSNLLPPPPHFGMPKNQYVTHHKIVSLYCNLSLKTEKFLAPPAQIAHKMLEFGRVRPLRKAKFLFMAYMYHNVLLLQQYLYINKAFIIKFVPKTSPKFRSRLRRSSITFNT